MNINGDLQINKVDICCGLSWGDEAKGKIVSNLASSGNYDFVCRWAGGNNAGHTIYLNGKKYKTHIVPCGVFNNITSIIGPDCVIHPESFFKEVEYLRENGFNEKCIKISPNTHIVQHFHINEDKEKYGYQGTTNNGIAPCYGDKYLRKGIRAIDCPDLSEYIWDEKLWGNVLCEGAQGFWLDINYGNYPYVTSSTTVPYGACSLGFPPQKISKIYGAAKIYDTRSGTDPDFPETLLEDRDLMKLVEIGGEIGTTTGRIRKTNWLNIDKLIFACNKSGTTDIIISKVDIIEKLGIFKLFHNEKIINLNSINEMKNYITTNIISNCPLVTAIIYSYSAETI
jgi:adenylosuccinate synthase